ncbi:MAG TPA: antibiotic biosynthesis monooxygenase family protein [Chloroflexota bacterium]
MVTHVVIQNIDPERRDEYIERYKEEWRLAALPGCHSAKILKAIENPGRVILIFEWDSIEVHRASNRLPAHDRLMNETVYKYQTAPSDYAHFESEEI